MNRRTLKKIAIAAAVLLVIFSLLIEYGQPLGIPSWQQLAASWGWQDAAPPVDGTLEVHILDVGNADCILVRQQDKTLLIDAGERGDADTIADYLAAHDIDRLDMVIATHPHADHIGGMAEIIREVEVGEFLMAFMPEEDTPTTSVYLRMLQALDERGVPVTEAAPSQTYTLGTATVQVLAPLQEDDDPNAMSVVTRLTFGDTAFLFMGDAESEVERQLLRAGCSVAADVLKVGHHGSNTGTHDAFLERVDPAYAVLTCGEGNSYGHPHREVLTRLREAAVETYRSDLHGDVVFTSDGTNITVQTEKGVA